MALQLITRPNALKKFHGLDPYKVHKIKISRVSFETVIILDTALDSIPILLLLVFPEFRIA